VGAGQCDRLAAGLGVAVPFIALALVPDASPFWVWAVMGIVSGVFMGLVVGAITGLGLVWLLRSEASVGSTPSAG
jgi:NhaP-type Na+/H+ or K+/H+ antiporter